MKGNVTNVTYLNPSDPKEYSIVHHNVQATDGQNGAPIQMMMSDKHDNISYHTIGIHSGYTHIGKNVGALLNGKMINSFIASAEERIQMKAFAYLLEQDMDVVQILDDYLTSGDKNKEMMKNV